jgi:hypothetical protein
MTLLNLLSKALLTSDTNKLLLILREIDFIYGHALGPRILKLRRIICVHDIKKRADFIEQEVKIIIEHIYERPL